MTNEVTTLESLVYYQMETLKDSFKKWPICFDLNPRLVASIVVVERLQYHTPEALAVIKRMSLYLLDIIDKWKNPVKTNEKWTNLSDWINCSRSFCRIKWETAMTAWQMQGEPFRVSESDLCKHTFDNDLAVKVACLILHVHMEQWKPFIDLKDRPEILATLYNISDFKNKKPHSNPQIGGSVGDVIADGELYQNLNFADRVMKVYNSSSMYKYVESLI